MKQLVVKMDKISGGNVHIKQQQLEGSAMAFKES